MQTARNWEVAGMSYDSTLSYADLPGFLCGTSHTYTMFDAEQGRALNLMQRPLVLMDCSVIAKRYMNMGYTKEALDTMQTLKQRALIAGAQFTLLWHNSFFDGPSAYQFYEALIHV